MILAGLAVFVLLMISMWKFNVLGRVKNYLGYGPKQEPKKNIFSWSEQKVGLLVRILVVLVILLLVFAVFQGCYYAVNSKWYSVFGKPETEEEKIAREAREREARERARAGKKPAGKK